MVGQISIKDLKTLFRAQDVMRRLAGPRNMGELAQPDRLGPAIALARTRLVAQRGRRRYIAEMLPPPVAYGLPGVTGEFGVVLASDPQHPLALRDNNIPVVTQIAELEQRRKDQVIKVVHRNGGIQEYWL